MRLSAVAVHYRTPELLASSVEALRRDCDAAGLACRVVVVDNGSARENRSLLRSAADLLLEPGENLGYAGGLNRGIREARADRLFLFNPDVEVLPGCVPILLEALDSAAVAGPRFYWDRGRRLLLPPTEGRTRLDEALRRLAPRSPRLVRLARRRWRRHARRHWLAPAPFESPWLSGALLAVRRDALERVGPFDEGFRLYFEETDWLLRLRAAGLRAVHVPSAEAVHLYDQSAAGEPRSGAWFAESRSRFEARHYGRAFTALLRGVEPLTRAEEPDPPEPTPADSPHPSALDLEAPAGAARPVWVEISAGAPGFPAAAELLGDPAGAVSWRLPAEVWERLRPGVYSVRAVDAKGVEGQPACLVRPGSPSGR